MPILIKKNNSWINPRELWVRKNDEWKPIISDQTNYEWASTDWSECTKECGGGIQERTVWCRSAVTGETLGDAVCEMVLGPKPEEIRECNTHSCVITDYTGPIGSGSICGSAATTDSVYIAVARSINEMAPAPYQTIIRMFGEVIYDGAPLTEPYIKNNFSYTYGTQKCSQQTGPGVPVRYYTQYFEVKRTQLS